MALPLHMTCPKAAAAHNSAQRAMATDRLKKVAHKKRQKKDE